MDSDALASRTQRAMHHFQPDPGAKPGNCAEAIIRAFVTDERHRPADASAYRKLARGRAPQGLCGAFYAAREILERERPELVPELEARFSADAGCTACRAIRRGGRAECRDCVESAASYLDEVLPE